MTDEQSPKPEAPKPDPHIHWTLSKGEPPEPPTPPESEEAENAEGQKEGNSENMAENEELPSEEATLIPEDSAKEEESPKENSADKPEGQEEPPRRKSLRERNIIRLLELGDEAVQMRDYRMARKYYNEAKDIFGSREAVLRLKELDKARIEYIRSLINSGAIEGRRVKRDDRRGGHGRRERDSRPDGREGRRPPFRKDGFKKEGRPFGEKPHFDKLRREDRPFRKDGDKSFSDRPGRKPFGRKPFGGKPGGRPFRGKPGGKFGGKRP